MNNVKRNNVILVSLSVLVMLMVVGYGAFQSVLTINGTSSVTSNWEIQITNITTKSIVGSAKNVEEPTFQKLSATFKTELTNPGDAAEYNIVVSNSGSVDAKLDKITLSDSNNPAIKFTTSGLTEGSTLKAGETTTLTVKVEYLTTGATLTSLSNTFTATLDYSQA